MAGLIYSPWQTAAGGETTLTIDVPNYPVAPGSESGVSVVSEDQGDITGGTVVSTYGSGPSAVANGVITATLRNGYTMTAGDRYRALYYWQPSAYVVTTGDSLTALIAKAQDIVGIEVPLQDDVYSSSLSPAIGANPDLAAGVSLWPGWANDARNDLVLSLTLGVGDMVLPASETAMTVTGARTYDLSGYGFLRVDNVGYGSAGGVRWLPVYNRDAGVLAGGANLDMTGYPFLAYATGMATLGFIAVPVDATQNIYVQGPRLPGPMSAGTDVTGLLPLCTEAVALGTAIRCCRHDRNRPELAAMKPDLMAEYKDKTTRLKLLLSRMDRPSGAYRMSEDAYLSAVPGEQGWG